MKIPSKYKFNSKRLVIVEEHTEFTLKDGSKYLMVILFSMKSLTRSGYIGIPLTHKLYAKGFHHMDVDVHGGVTYSDYYIDFVIPREEGYYFVGFGCNHASDVPDYDSWYAYLEAGYREYISNIPELYKIFLTYNKNALHWDSKGVACSYAYTYAQCAKLLSYLLEHK